MTSPYDPVGPQQLGLPNYLSPVPQTPAPLPQITRNIPIITTPSNPETIPVTAGPQYPIVTTPPTQETLPVTSGSSNKKSTGFGDVPRGILSSLLPGIVKPNDLTLFGGGDKGKSSGAPNDKILSTLLSAGYDQTTANSLLQKYNDVAGKNAALKNLPPEFADIIKQHEAEKAAASQPPVQKIMDPLAMQLFYQNTIAPYLDKIGAGIKQTGAGLGQTLSAQIPNLPPAYQAVLSQSLPGVQSGISAMADAYSGAAAAAPQVESLQNQLAAAWQAQKLAQYYAEKNIAYSGGANSSGVPTADELAQIQQLIGK